MESGGKGRKNYPLVENANFLTNDTIDSISMSLEVYFNSIFTV
jgi:hypothetical protein